MRSYAHNTDCRAFALIYAEVKRITQEERRAKERNEQHIENCKRFCESDDVIAMMYEDLKKTDVA